MSSLQLAPPPVHAVRFAMPCLAALLPIAAHAQMPAYHVAGTSGSAFGSALAAAGDVNADGHDDWLVGAPLSSTTAYAAGSASLRSGLDGSALLVFHGDSAGDQAGCSVAAVGDVDGDGVPDLAYGAWLDDPAGVNSGRVRVRSGANGAELHALAGPAAHAHYGQALAAAGDVDLDGVPDFAVGAPGAGVVHVCSGATGALLRAYSGPVSAAFGHALASLGDQDGDGIADLALTAPYSDGGGLDTGRVFVHSGASGTLLWSLTGASNGAHLGSSAARLGDVNGDGLDDLALGAPGTGEASVHASGGALVWKHQLGGLYGWSIAGAGDWNSDGVAEVLIGTPTANGAAYLRTGQSGALLASLPGLGSSAWIEAFGSAVSSAGDVDGDGRTDLIVGAPEAALGAPAAGRAAVYTLTGVVVPTTPLLLSVSGPQASTSLEAPVVSAAGDVDGDGYGDLLVGARNEATNKGRVQLISFATGQVLASHEGAVAQDALGVAVAGVGDVNLDGVPDYAAGAPNEDGGGDAAGGVHVWSGANGAVLHHFTGSGPDQAYGSALAMLGDYDGDGFADVLIGAPQYETASGFATGQVQVRSGRNGSVLLAQSGGMPGDRFGSALDGFSDLDGDLVPEIVVGAYADEQAALNAGKAYLLDGASGAALQTLSGDYSAQIGFRVSRAGDVDGDGIEDWMASSGGSVYREVRVLSGATGAELLMLSSTAQSTGFGAGIGSAGDLDGDGRADVLVGEPFAASQQGRVLAFRAANGAPLLAWTPPNGKVFGSSIAELGDLDGDGRAEFASTAKPSGSNPWKAYVVSGAPHSLTASPFAIPTATGGTQTFTLDAGPALAGKPYLLLGTLSGTSPGLPLGALTLPLNPDAYLTYTVSAPNTPPLSGSLGLLGASGGASASFVLPPGSAALAGIEAHHAFVALGASSVLFASNAVVLHLP